MSKFSAQSIKDMLSGKKNPRKVVEECLPCKRKRIIEQQRKGKETK